jgi:RHS repeat-associated protein
MTTCIAKPKTRPHPRNRWLRRWSTKIAPPPAFRRRSLAYDASGDQTSLTDPSGNVTAMTYDAQGRELTQTAANGGVTKSNYDLAGNLSSITDPVGNITSYSYNAANELTATTNPQGYTSTNNYNAAGELTSTTDANGHTIDYTYDQAGRETSQTWVNGNYTANFAYNADGQLTSASDPFSSYSYSYNALGQETNVSNAGTPGVPTVTLNYSYDGFGNLSGVSDSLGGSISYAYNSANELTGLGLSVSSTLDAQVTMAYDGTGNLTGLTRTAPSANGDTITTSLSYDKANELTNITHTDASTNTLLASYTYAYNASGDLTSYQDNNGNSLTYAYDTNGELTSASGTLAGSNYSVNYSYDLNGNRTMTGYQTGSGNELLSDGTYSYTYDKNGNTLTQTNIATGSVTYYTWDFENRLTEVKVENSQGQVLNDETFTYDMFGNRIGVSLNGVQQLYTVYDGSNPYMDFNGSGQLTQRYLTNPNALSQYYGQVSASGTTQWFLTDNLNSIRQVISTSGSSLDAITYDPYGNIISQTNASNAPRMGFAGGVVDSLTGNVQFDARPYSPVDGQFKEQDPLKFAAGDSNLDRYVGNDPTNAIDPTGEGRWVQYPGSDNLGWWYHVDGEGIWQYVKEENSWHFYSPTGYIFGYFNNSWYLFNSLLNVWQPITSSKIPFGAITMPGPRPNGPGAPLTIFWWYGSQNSDFPGTYTWWAKLPVGFRLPEIPTSLPPSWKPGKGAAWYKPEESQPGESDSFGWPTDMHWHPIDIFPRGVGNNLILGIGIGGTDEGKPLCGARAGINWGPLRRR